MDIVFEVINKAGRKIYLSSKIWSHITRRHPYMSNYIDEIKETVQKPDKITTWSLDNNIRYYYKYYKHEKSFDKYILVIVKYLNNSGFIITTYFVRYIK